MRQNMKLRKNWLKVPQFCLAWCSGKNWFETGTEGSVVVDSVKCLLFRFCKFAVVWFCLLSKLHAGLFLFYKDIFGWRLGRSVHIYWQIIFRTREYFKCHAVLLLNLPLYFDLFWTRCWWHFQCCLKSNASIPCWWWSLVGPGILLSSDGWAVWWGLGQSGNPWLRDRFNSQYGKNISDTEFHNSFSDITFQWGRIQQWQVTCQP